MATNPSGQETTAVEDATLPTPAVGGVIFGRDVNNDDAKPLKFDGDYLLTSSGGGPPPPASGLTRANISLTTAGDNVIIAAVAATVIRIYHINFITATATNIIFKSAATNISGTYTFGANQGIALDPPANSPVIICGTNEAFQINLSADAIVGGFCWYSQVA